MKKEDLKALFKEYERQAKEELANVAAVREDARGILKPEVIRRQVNKRHGIVLAYGMMGEVSYSLSDLKRFLKSLEQFQKQSHIGGKSVRGVPYAKLFLASRAIDVERSKTVRNVILYQRKGNILYFQVSGNSRPHYRVQIRLEEWDDYIAEATPIFKAVNSIVRGRISFECPCGRHQYWYRYMATLGKYAIEPLETGFPKIRNKGLFGCCCKHVLKVLKELVSNRIVFILCKELEKERAKSGFSSSRKGQILSESDLRIARAKKLSNAAANAFRKYEKEAKELLEQTKPRAGRKMKVSKELLTALKAIIPVAKVNPAIRKEMLTSLGQVHNMSLADIEAIIKENKLQ
ncbi:MAG: hypothetical protein K2H64_03530 [Desulfovibrio sp.]|nr:hypothetical protein [Desulfovibrio sp.]